MATKNPAKKAATHTETKFDPKKIAPVLVKNAHIKGFEAYKKLYNQSIKNPTAFWSKIAKEYLTWFKPFKQVLKSDFVHAKNEWFVGGKTNLCYNALDRHLTTARKNKAALIWEADDPEVPSRTYTYQQLHYEVCRVANALVANGVKKGDRVTIYMPMIPELAMATLACARIGAVHSIIFGGFSPDSIKDRIIDAASDFIITADTGYRGGKVIPIKANVDAALEKVTQTLNEGFKGVVGTTPLTSPAFTGVKKVLIVRHTSDAINFVPSRDLWWHEEIEKVNAESKAVEMDSEDPLFLLYTSGSTGKPKGVLHTTAGYGVYCAFTHKIIFDVKDEDTYWCTADLGWVTGHSYILYGPLINGATSLMFEGIPTYPNVDRFWQVIAKHRVSIFYTAPTAIRALMRFGDAPVAKHDLSSLRLLGSVGEPINPEAWLWYHRAVGKGKCPIVDTWWQTETGGILISAIPGAITTKPGSATLPFFGVQPVLVDGDGKILKGPAEGNLCLAYPWPAIMRGVYGDKDRFYQTYFSTFKGYYFTGDGCRRDKDGYYWITGRVDDVINVSGHRLGTAEVESALVLSPKVAEAAVVGYPHEIKGQGIYAYVILKEGVQASDELRKELAQQVAKEISPIAKPDAIHFTPGLPKTRSGKIMRRILRKIAAGEIDALGDTTTLADPSVVDILVKERQS
ncbi:MAG: acetate--CoA ligase [Spirochaetes bacterium]|nr:acetate--CoA ligase [Spirochaetota bacterium]